MPRLLIANRGEIAIRIMRSAHALGFRTISVFSDADAEAWHRKVANESVYIGKSPPQESYLNIEAIIRAAKNSGADFVHPGYGFLSENRDFVARLEEVSLIFAWTF